MTGLFWDITAREDLSRAASEVLSLSEERASLVLALHGNLGAGKTTFVQELARQLGVKEAVVSPTFVIMKIYETTDKTFSRLVHIDAYRLETIEEFRILEAGEEFSRPGTIICIEWAEKIASLLPEQVLNLSFAATADGQRTLTCDES